MTTPTIVPPKFQGTAADYLNVKCSRDGQANIYVQQVSVPTGTPAATIIGLVPFNRGMRISPRASSVENDALGAGSVALGFVYDDNVTYTNNQTAFLAATGVTTAGVLQPTTGATFVAAANGWVTATTSAATTSATGNLTASFVISYDGVNVAN
jgi:hypothetical protein